MGVGIGVNQRVSAVVSVVICGRRTDYIVFAFYGQIHYEGFVGADKSRIGCSVGFVSIRFIGQLRLCSSQGCVEGRGFFRRNEAHVAAGVGQINGRGGLEVRVEVVVELDVSSAEVHAVVLLELVEGTYMVNVCSCTQTEVGCVVRIALTHVEHRGVCSIGGNGFEVIPAFVVHVGYNFPFLYHKVCGAFGVCFHLARTSYE